MTHPHDNPVRNALRSLDQQRADTLRPDAAPTGDAAEVLRLREERNEISAECVKLRARLAAASHRADDADARATAAEARVADLLSDRADAAEVLVTEVERAQAAERRAAEMTAALRSTAHLCDIGCDRFATHSDREWQPPRYACDNCAKPGHRRDWRELPCAAVLRSLDGVSR